MASYSVFVYDVSPDVDRDVLAQHVDSLVTPSGTGSKRSWTTCDDESIMSFNYDMSVELEKDAFDFSGQQLQAFVLPTEVIEKTTVRLRTEWTDHLKLGELFSTPNEREICVNTSNGVVTLHGQMNVIIDAVRDIRRRVIDELRRSQARRASTNEQRKLAKDDTSKVPRDDSRHSVSQVGRRTTEHEGAVPVVEDRCSGESRNILRETSSGKASCFSSLRVKHELAADSCESCASAIKNYISKCKVYERTFVSPTVDEARPNSNSQQLSHSQASNVSTEGDKIRPSDAVDHRSAAVNTSGAPEQHNQTSTTYRQVYDGHESSLLKENANTVSSGTSDGDAAGAGNKLDPAPINADVCQLATVSNMQGQSTGASEVDSMPKVANDRDVTDDRRNRTASSSTVTYPEPKGKDDHLPGNTEHRSTPEGSRGEGIKGDSVSVLHKPNEKQQKTVINSQDGKNVYHRADDSCNGTMPPGSQLKSRDVTTQARGDQDSSVTSSCSAKDTAPSFTGSKQNTTHKEYDAAEQRNVESCSDDGSNANNVAKILENSGDTSYNAPDLTPVGCPFEANDHADDAASAAQAEQPGSSVRIIQDDDKVIDDCPSTSPESHDTQYQDDGKDQVTKLPCQADAKTPSSTSASGSQCKELAADKNTSCISNVPDDEKNRNGASSCNVSDQGLLKQMPNEGGKQNGLALIDHVDPENRDPNDTRVSHGNMRNTDNVRTSSIIKNKSKTLPGSTDSCPVDNNESLLPTSGDGEANGSGSTTSSTPTKHENGAVVADTARGNQDNPTRQTSNKASLTSMNDQPPSTCPTITDNAASSQTLNAPEIKTMENSQEGNDGDQKIQDRTTEVRTTSKRISTECGANPQNPVVVQPQTEYHHKTETVPSANVNKQQSEGSPSEKDNKASIVSVANPEHVDETAAIINQAEQGNSVNCKPSTRFSVPHQPAAAESIALQLAPNTPNIGAPVFDVKYSNDTDNEGNSCQNVIHVCRASSEHSSTCSEVDGGICSGCEQASESANSCPNNSYGDAELRIHNGGCDEKNDDKKCQQATATAEKISTNTSWQMDESLWEFINFSDAQSHWNVILNAVYLRDHKEIVELHGNVNDIERLKKYCDAERLHRKVAKQMVRVPAGVELRRFVQFLTREANGKVLVHRTKDSNYCEVIGKTSDIQELNNAAGEQYQEPAKYEFQSDSRSVYPPDTNASKRAAEMPSPPSNVNIKPVFSNEYALTTAKSRLRVTIETGDILSQQCEVLVSPCNGALDLSSGLAKHIAANAGKELSQDCKDYSRKHKPLPVGEVMDTRAGKLPPPARRVIHAHGPNMSDYRDINLCCGDLERTFLNCFSSASRLRASSIALPAISSSNGGVPYEIVAAAACAALIQFDELLSRRSSSERYPRQIKFVNINPKVTRSMVGTFRQLLGVPTPTNQDNHSGKPRGQSSASDNHDGQHQSGAAPQPSVSNTRKKSDSQQDNSSSDPSIDSASSSVSPDADDNSCPICMDNVNKPKRLPCGHVFCKACIKRSLKYQNKCPCCGKLFGEMKGDQPRGGKMEVNRERQDLDGYTGCGRIVITYHIPDGKQQAHHPNPGRPYKGAFRTAYLPDNAEGREICSLLRRAFDAGLIFTVGRSTTSGQEDVVTWNDIHHKTKPTGPYGYPDPNYLGRVREELAAKGITSTASK